MVNEFFAIAALGDSSYEHFCGDGQQFNDLLQERQSLAVTKMLTIDARDTLDLGILALKWLADFISKT